MRSEEIKRMGEAMQNMHGLMVDMVQATYGMKEDLEKEEQEVHEGLWKPKANERYYILRSELSNGHRSYTCFNDKFDKSAIKNTIVRKHKQEIVEDVWFHRLIRNITERRRQLQGEWMVDWDDNSEEKWLIFYDNHEIKAIPGDTLGSFNTLGIYKSRDIAKKIIDEFQEELYHYSCYLARIN